MATDPGFIRPDWPAPAGVEALSTTRAGGVSSGVYASLNLGDHVGDDPSAVIANRRLVASVVPGTPVWLEQIHGCEVAEIDRAGTIPPIDAAVCRTPGKACVIMTADCLPVLFCDRFGTVVGAAHAGWRGLLAGVLENTVTAMGVPPAHILAWFGPAIGPSAFEVGEEVRAAFVSRNAAAASAFVANERGRWLADLYLLARQRLAACGVVDVSGGDRCTFSEPDCFFSYRRDGRTGRMATMVWLTDKR
ncbi:MAG TPA: peptidoglycan editing factor PgeF [Rhodocyclaceae bacterium]